MKIAVITDTGSGMTMEEAKELGVHLAPIPFLIDGEDYVEGVNLTSEQFYEKLMGGADVSTSQVNVNEMVKLWKELLKTNDQIVHIPLSSGLSASCENLIAASKEFAGKVFVVNNRRISVTQKRAVLDTLEMIKEGKNAREISDWLEETGDKSSIYIMVTTLKYLKKGGRITPAAAAIGTLLKIKPILQIQGDKLDKFCQVISYQQGKKKMIDQLIHDIENRFIDLVHQGKFNVYVAYTHCEDKAKEFVNELNAALKKYDLTVSYANPLSLPIACHIGEGSLAVACSIIR